MLDEEWATVDSLQHPQPMHSRHEIIDHRHRFHRVVLFIVAAAVLVGALVFGISAHSGKGSPKLVVHRHPAPVAAPVISTTTTTAPTEFLPITPGSGVGCTSGITDGVQWIKYVVKSGDTLSNIAACFNLNGYNAVYQQNAEVIGNNPGLIFPGQVFTITLSNNKLTPAVTSN